MMGLLVDVLHFMTGEPANPDGFKKYEGISNPSGAVALNNHAFIVADDEDNDLRIFARGEGGKSLQKIKLSKVFKGKVDDGKGEELDIESGAEIDGVIFWLGSHSTNKEGKNRPARRCLLAVSLSNDRRGEFDVEEAGDMYTNLLGDLLEDPRFNAFNLEQAGTTQPKAPGGLSIEGLAATPQKSLLIGFRNPLAGGTMRDGVLTGGKAIVVELLNPLEVIRGGQGRFADPITLDLAGFGIREITLRKLERYLIVAGPYHGNEAGEPFRLYDWDKSSGKLEFLVDADLQGLNVEAAIFYPDTLDRVQLLSDDGKLALGDRFRSLDLNLKP